MGKPLQCLTKRAVLQQGRAVTKNQWTVLACLAVLVVCGWMLFRPDGKPRAEDLDDYRRPWVCEACDHRFLALPGPGRRTCPQCGREEAVQSVIYVCGACGAEFEAYRRVDHYDEGAPPGPDGKVVLPLPHFKRPGGEWTTDRSELDDIACPKCGNTDAATLREKTYGPNAATAEEDSSP
jgi:hypothetical protein